MAWTIKFSAFSVKQLRKLDKPVAKKILAYLRERVATQKDPRKLGKALLHDKAGFWRYSIENYRIICQIQDKELVVLVIRLGHRRDIYDKK